MNSLVDHNVMCQKVASTPTLSTTGLSTLVLKRSTQGETVSDTVVFIVIVLHNPESY